VSNQTKSFLRSASVYTALNFLPAGFSLVITPLFTNHLKGTEEYGLIILANFFFALFAMFIGLGFDSAYGIKFFHYNKNQDKQDSLLTTVIFLMVLSFLALTVVVYFFGSYFFSQLVKNPSFTFSNFGLFTLGMGLATVTNALMLSYYRNVNNLKLYSFQALAMAVVPTLSQVICIFYVSNTARAVVATRSLTSLLAVFPFVFLFIRDKGFRIHKEFLKPIFRLSLPFFFYGIIIFLFENVDRLLVEKNFTEVNALSIYGLAVTFAALGEMVRASMASALSPMVFNVMANENEEAKINRLYRLFITVILVLISLALLVIEPVFTLVIKNHDFSQSLQYIPFLFLALLPKVYYSIYQLPLSYYGRVKILPFINLISLLCGLACFYSTLPYLHLYAVIFSLFISRTLQATFTFFYLKKIKNVYRHREVEFTKETFLVIICMVVIGLGSVLYTKHYIPFWAIGFSTCIVAGSVGLKTYQAEVSKFFKGLRRVSFH